MDRSFEIPDDLVKAAQELTGEVDETEAIKKALQLVAESRKLKTPLDGMLELAGKIELWDDYDYKAMRAGGTDDSHN